MKKTLVTLALVAVGIAAFAVEFDWKTNIALNRALNDNRAKQDPAVVAQAMEYADGVTARTDQEKISLIAIRRTARTQTAGTDRSWKANKEFVDLPPRNSRNRRPCRNIWGCFTSGTWRSGTGICMRL